MSEPRLVDPNSPDVVANRPSSTLPAQPGRSADQPPPDVSSGRGWLSSSDQKFVAVCVAILLLLTGYHWAKLGAWGSVPIERDRLPERRYDFRIDINSASWVEWTQIEGIGEATASRIVADRDAKGPFRNIDDLRRVKGIGPKTLEKMRPFLREPVQQALPSMERP